jgi:hypothetical protein
MTAQLSRPVLRLLSGLAACMSRQLVQLHGAGNRSPTRRGGDVRSLRSRRVSWPTPQSELGELARDRDLSCEAESYRARQRLVGGGPFSGELVGDARNWSEMLPTGRKRDVLPVRVLIGVLSPPRLESWP